MIKPTELKKRLEAPESRLTDGSCLGDASRRGSTAPGGLGV